jgi:endonuclease/exonuclease/phosphatase family metal-dependent hydrolase
LNLDLDLDKRRDLFTDAEHRDVESYNYVASRLFDVGMGRGSTAEPDRRLDYIFINAELGVTAAGAWKGRRVREMDHDPVVADLRFVNP